MNNRFSRLQHKSFFNIYPNNYKGVTKKRVAIVVAVDFTCSQIKYIIVLLLHCLHINADSHFSKVPILKRLNFNEIGDDYFESF